MLSEERKKQEKAAAGEVAEEGKNGQSLITSENASTSVKSSSPIEEAETTTEPQAAPSSGQKPQVATTATAKGQ